VSFEFVTPPAQWWPVEEWINTALSQGDVVVPVGDTKAWFLLDCGDTLVEVLAFRVRTPQEMQEAADFRRWLERNRLYFSTETTVLRQWGLRRRHTGCSISPIRCSDDPTLIPFLLHEFAPHGFRNRTEWMADFRHFREYHLDEVMDMEALTFRITEHPDTSGVLAVAD